MSKGALGLLAAYWPEDTARYAHVPLQRVTEGCVHKPAESEGDRVALATGERSVRFAEVSRLTRTVAGRLREHVPPGARVAVLLDDPVERLLCVAGALEADLLVWPAPSPPDPAALQAFAPTHVVSRRPVATGHGEEPPAWLAPDALLAGEPAEAPGRPKLRNPILALPRPGGGEVVHSHKTLLASAIAFGSFFLLEPGARMLLLEPPDHWLGLVAWLATWQRAGTVLPAWPGLAEPVPSDPVDYVVLATATAEARLLRPGTRPFARRIGVGALLAVEEGISVARRRRIGRRLGAPVLTVFGRNDLGPVLASHPTWYLDDALGIPLPNVDLRPLDPAEGRELAIGWDAVEEAEVGVKSSLAPAGGELTGEWLRTRRIGHVDPTGLYFFRGKLKERGEP